MLPLEVYDMIRLEAIDLVLDDLERTQLEPMQSDDTSDCDCSACCTTGMQTYREVVKLSSPGPAAPPPTMYTAMRDSDFRQESLQEFFDFYESVNSSMARPGTRTVRHTDDSSSQFQSKSGSIADSDFAPTIYSTMLFRSWSRRTVVQQSTHLVDSTLITGRRHGSTTPTVQFPSIFRRSMLIPAQRSAQQAPTSSMINTQ